MHVCMYTIILLLHLSVCRCSQTAVAILARSSRVISETVRIDSHSFLSRVRIYRFGLGNVYPASAIYVMAAMVLIILHHALLSV